MTWQVGLEEEVQELSWPGLVVWLFVELGKPGQPQEVGQCVIP